MNITTTIKLEDCREGEYKESRESGFEKILKSLYSHHTENDKKVNYYKPSFQTKSSQLFVIEENNGEGEDNYSFLKINNDTKKFI